MSKKIGCVIAYHKGHTNYGTSLVGYALVKKLQQLNYQVEIINYEKHLSFIQKIKFLLNAILCGSFKEIIHRLFYKRILKQHPIYAEGIKERTKCVEAYKEEKLVPLFRTYSGYQNLHNGSTNYEAIIVGSDQVWTPLSLPNKFYNLLFAKDSVRKIAYASSFGVSSIPDFQKKSTGAYLDRFYKIGVREKKGKEIVDSLSHQIAQVVADPTILLNANEWNEEIGLRPSDRKEPYIFCYFLGKNIEARNAAKKLRAKTNYKIICLRHMDEFVPEDEFFGDEAPYNINPNDFLRLIHDASYVCTDSFHCTAFSIQFHKKFMTFYRYSNISSTSRNSRIDSIFEQLQVNKAHIFNGDIEKINEPLDWSSIDSKLNELRKSSIDFLKNALA